MIPLNNMANGVTRRMPYRPRWAILADWSVVLIGVALSLCCLARNTVEATESPTTVVQQTTDAVLAALADQNLTAKDKHRKIEKIAYTHFDFPVLSRLVLGRNWKVLSPAQQDQFVGELKQHLAATYGKGIDNYHHEHIVITGDRAEVGGDWTVKTKVVGSGGAGFEVDYRLRQTDGEWRAIDVIIEGVSLVANYRAQFQDIVSNQGAAALIQQLHEKNANGEPMETSTRQ
jgi:phospholipid transport system substrate-binding protein